MDQDRLAVLVEEYKQRGESLHDLLGVERLQLRKWLDGARIPRSRARQLEWWAGSLRVLQALEASGLPECAQMSALDQEATAAITGRAPRKEQDRAARAALDHQASCDLCRKREAVRLSAGPVKGEPFPGYHDLTRSPEEMATALWSIALVLGLCLVAAFALRDADGDTRLPWVIGWVGVLMPWLLWDGARRSRSNQIAAALCVACGLAGLGLTDFRIVLASPGPFLLGPFVIVCVGVWIRRRTQSE